MVVMVVIVVMIVVIMVVMIVVIIMIVIVIVVVVRVVVEDMDDLVACFLGPFHCIVMSMIVVMVVIVVMIMVVIVRGLLRRIRGTAGGILVAPGDADGEGSACQDEDAREVDHDPGFLPENGKWMVASTRSQVGSALESGS
jgi:hypothetical protein